jgi:4-hydroxy-tetrahydrodipicolinate synthase
MNELGGIISAAITPMEKDGSVDYDAYANQIGFLTKAGVNGFFINGTTGEGTYLSIEERRRCFEIAKVNKEKNQFLCLACIAASTREVVEQIRTFEKLEPDYFVVVPPYYFGADGRMIEKHYMTVAQATERPIIIYNIPQRTVNDVFEADIRALMASGKFAGMKDSSGDFIRFSRWALEGPRGFNWIQGEDLLDAESFIAGASGVVTGLSNIFPEPYVKMYAAFQAGDLKTMIECQRAINRLATIIDVSDGKVIPAIKAAVSLFGRCERWDRIEAESLSQSTISKIGEIIGKQ